MSSAGITRVANVTGLDRIGIPVVMVVRPNSRSVSVSQGKGMSLAAAKVSGVMEALETFVAESVNVVSATATVEALGRQGRTIDWARLPRNGVEPPPANMAIAWASGIDLLTGDAMWAPAEMVHTNYTLPQPTGSGWFHASSNGLAAGNTTDEALVHALCEIIERDCRTRWLSDARLRMGTRINAKTIASDDVLGLLERLEMAGFVYGIWHLPSSMGIPAFLCTIREGDVAWRLSARCDTGSGCHPCREIALFRAVSEAAQMRLTYLTGARDDQGHEHFTAPATAGHGLATRNEAAGKDFGTIESFENDAPAQDLSLILDRLDKRDCRQVFAYHFPVSPLFGLDDAPLAIARVIVPEMAGPAEAFNQHLFGPDRIH